MAKNPDTEKKGGKLKNVLIILVAFIFMGAGTFAGVYFYMQNKGDKTVSVSQAYVKVGEEMTVNLSDESPKRFLKATVSIGYDENDKDTAKEVEKKSVEIKDKTLFYLKSKKVEDFTAKNEENLKKGLVDEINKILVDGKILDVYFDNILTQ